MIKTRLKHQGKPQYLLLFYCLFFFLAIYLALKCLLYFGYINFQYLKYKSNTNVPKKLSNI